MARYLTQFAYTSEAWKALTHNPVDRTEVLRALGEKLGARVIDLYYSFGEWDGLVITEAPDDTTVAALVMAAVSPGHIKAIQTTRLLTADEALQAMRKAGSATYTAPKS